jgi:hypothetical protein
MFERCHLDEAQSFSGLVIAPANAAHGALIAPQPRVVDQALVGCLRVGRDRDDILGQRIRAGSVNRRQVVSQLQRMLGDLKRGVIQGIGASDVKRRTRDEFG